MSIVRLDQATWVWAFISGMTLDKLLKLCVHVFPVHSHYFTSTPGPNGGRHRGRGKSIRGVGCTFLESQFHWTERKVPLPYRCGFHCCHQHHCCHRVSWGTVWEKKEERWIKGKRMPVLFLRMRILPGPWARATVLFPEFSLCHSGRYQGRWG